MTWEQNQEVSRLENFYDWCRFESEDYSCVLCEEDFHTLSGKFGLQKWFTMTSWEQDLERNRLITKWERSLFEESLTWGK